MKEGVSRGLLPQGAWVLGASISEGEDTNTAGSRICSVEPALSRGLLGNQWAQKDGVLRGRSHGTCSWDIPPSHDGAARHVTPQGGVSKPRTAATRVTQQWHVFLVPQPKVECFLHLPVQVMPGAGCMSSSEVSELGQLGTCGT